MAAILELREVRKEFGAHRAVDGVTLTIEQGELFVLVGPSGCGKSTTLRMVAGFEHPDGGDILLDGEPIASLPPYRRNVSTVFQSYALFPHLTARENIEFGIRQKRMGDVERRVGRVAELLDLGDKLGRRPAQLSGGEKQRVALARSLVIEPALLLLDEPLSALDPKLRRQVRPELKSLQQRLGLTFLMVTHDQEEAMSMASRIGVMNQGRLEQVGTPREIYHAPATRFVAGFSGIMNWIEGVGLRPESICLSRDGEGAPAQVQQVMFLGNCVHVAAALECGEVVTAEVTASGDVFQAGERVWVRWAGEDEIRVE
jgi:ABC-type Fe3+/spermidine/putrescine transport system ATPase subunit